jgi:hypothetical protein
VLHEVKLSNFGYNAVQAMSYHFEVAKYPNTLKVDFITTDLEVALTFAEIARQTGDGAKAFRNRQNARKAYDFVLLYLGTASLSRSEQQVLKKKLAILKSTLLSLGESF